MLMGQSVLAPLDGAEYHSPTQAIDFRRLETKVGIRLGRSRGHCIIGYNEPY